MKLAIASILMSSFSLNQSQSHILSEKNANCYDQMMKVHARLIGKYLMDGENVSDNKSVVDTFQQFQTTWHLMYTY